MVRAIDRLSSDLNPCLPTVGIPALVFRRGRSPILSDGLDLSVAV